jgi:inosose dehydratase
VDQPTARRQHDRENASTSICQDILLTGVSYVMTIATVTEERTTIHAGPAEGSPLRDRVAGAPISWGVSEVPGWGFQLEAGAVLAQMRELGLAATEFGPDRFLEACLATGARVVVLAAATGTDGYDVRPRLDDAGWATMLRHLDLVADRAAARGVVAALHPHMGTMVQSGEETERVLGGSRVGLCVDTGHLMAGGADPVALTAAHAGRVRHVHLKDVDAALAARVRAGELTFREAVRDGLFRPLGDGDVDVASLVRTLEGAGYTGWYVLEQDVMLAAEPRDEGPVADVRTCLAYLTGGGSAA